MPKRISIAIHLSLEELEKRYRQAKDGVESRQYQIIWLIAQGKKTQEVEEITGDSRTWMYALVKRYARLLSFDYAVVERSRNTAFCLIF
jgi:hypothetical protein